MIVSKNWLQDYVPLAMSDDELTTRLTMSGLNLEGVDQVDGDTAIDLEVTSNRPDCLGHIGVAREISVLFGEKLSIPEPSPAAGGEKGNAATSVSIECEDLCPRYIARVIRGVKVAQSPDWLKQRLAAVGIAAVNNIVDITNYVLMECGQPLHAFDFDKLHGGRIVVRRPKAGEKLVAIDHNEYKLGPETCVIADADRPVAIGGVMGGADTEIGNNTVNLLIEAADFDALSIRTTARALGLHSDSSYRFERGVDPAGIDWASRRCCELILDIAGGELIGEPAVAGEGRPAARPPISLRFGQIPRILGIDVSASRSTEILRSLGLESAGGSDDEAAFVPPSWRGDLTREADLIEEVARIYGYEHIPDDVPVPLELSQRSRRDRVADELRQTLTACGFYEAVTFSLVSEETCRLFQPRGDRPLVQVQHSSWRLENILRQSLIPSLLQSRRENERHGTFDAHLFEIAKIYLDAAPERPESEVEPTVVGLVSGRSFTEMKGVLETLCERLGSTVPLELRPSEVAGFTPGRGAELLIGGELLGFLGELDRSVTDRLDLRDAVTACELDVQVLEKHAELTPTFTPLPQHPSIERDLNFVLDEEVTWNQLAKTVKAAAGGLLEGVEFGGQYRGKQIGPDKKSYVIQLNYRAADRTLTGEEVDASVADVVAACRDALNAELRG